MSYTISSNASKTYDYFRALRVQVPSRVGAVSERAAKKLQSAVKAVVPVDTGQYRDSITIDKSSPNRATYTFEVGSDVPYARVLEFGFVGTDSDGNTISRPPRPHWRPLMDEFENSFVQDIRDVLI